VEWEDSFAKGNQPDTRFEGPRKFGGPVKKGKDARQRDFFKKTEEPRKKTNLRGR